VTAQTATGATATSFTGAITVALGANTTGATLAGGTTAAAVAGVATFSGLTLDRVGTGYTLTASATGLTGATSAAFNITPGPANRLAFTVQPAASSAGAAIAPAVQVTARDAQGNTATSFTGGVTLTLGTNPVAAVLSGATTNAVAGIATFSGLSVDKAGTGLTLVATATGLTAATSSPFNVTAPPTNSTRLYLSPILDFKLRAAATANTGAGIELCLSTMEWSATLTSDMVGTAYVFNLGVKTAFTSSGTGNLRAEIIHKRGSVETVLATTTFSTTSTYVVQRATVTGPDAATQTGDLVLLRVRIVVPSPGTPCIAEFNGPATDNYIEVPRVTIQ
jgi:hypothetical protein